MSKSSKDFVYVVTRDGRRVEPENYSSLKDANIRAHKLIETIKSFDKSSKKNSVKVVKTTIPHRVR
jgi:hypothetical protein